jgi:hypothetical protein
MKILKFVNLKVSYNFRIFNAILNYLVCNMMKVFTRPTSASDFLTIKICSRFMSLTKYKIMVKQNAKMLENAMLCSFEFQPPSWTSDDSDAILYLTKKFFYKICATKIQVQINKQNAKMFKSC